jgi:hypothetical protein
MKKYEFTSDKTLMFLIWEKFKTKKIRFIKKVRFIEEKIP